jgi:2-keto-4-pentenoate hydratase/2-oxohepta-3-ene-1,7-dioic acid hydratase in catechol pathway
LKLATFKARPTADVRLGVIVKEDSIIVDLILAYASYRGLSQEDAFEEIPQEVTKLLSRGDLAVKKVRDLTQRIKQEIAEGVFKNEKGKEVIAHKLGEVKLCAPIPKPPKNIFCLAVNYPDHAKEGGRDPPQNPVLFTKPWTSIIGTEDSITYPRIARKLDYEAELAVVMGKSGRRIPENQAYNYVAGYTVLNDISEREIQFSDKQFFRAKSFDTFAPMGPCLVTSDDISDPHNLKIQLRVNGETRQNGNTSNMIFKIPFIISFVSEAITLEPGDVISTGTPGGVGIYAKPEPRLLKPGDVVEAEIESIGILRNYVKEERY